MGTRLGMERRWTPHEDWIKLATGTVRLIEADASGDFEVIGWHRIGSAR